MSQQFRTVTTNAGRNAVREALSQGKTVKLSHMSVGDGGGNPVTPLSTMTKLVNEQFRAQINDITLDPATPDLFTAELFIPQAEGGWYIREVGLWMDDGTLFAVGNTPLTEKPDISSGAATDLLVRLIIRVLDAATVSIEIDPAQVLATREYVDRKLDAHNKDGGAHETLARKSVQIKAGTGLTGGGTLEADRTLTVKYGNTAGTACQGNDVRLADARTPKPHKATHQTGGSDAITPADIGAAAKTIQIKPGTGLTGGGTLEADRTLTVSYGTARGHSVPRERRSSEQCPDAHGTQSHTQDRGHGRAHSCGYRCCPDNHSGYRRNRALRRRFACGEPDAGSHLRYGGGHGLSGKRRSSEQCPDAHGTQSHTQDRGHGRAHSCGYRCCPDDHSGYRRNRALRRRFTYGEPDVGSHLWHGYGHGLSGKRRSSEQCPDAHGTQGHTQDRGHGCAHSCGYRRCPDNRSGHRRNRALRRRFACGESDADGQVRHWCGYGVSRERRPRDSFRSLPAFHDWRPALLALHDPARRTRLGERRPRAVRGLARTEKDIRCRRVRRDVAGV